MMTKKINIILACLATVLSCTQLGEINPEIEVVEKVNMTFSAVIEEGDKDTKTVLDGQLGDERRKVLWTPGDEIGVGAISAENMNFEKFTLSNTENSQVGEFVGTISFASEYFAIYPYSGSTRIMTTDCLFNIPQEQKYVPNSFSPDCAPMVAKAKYGETLKFYNLCGLLALKLKGTECVERITFLGKGANGKMMDISGTFGFSLSFTDLPTITSGYGAKGGPTYKSTTLVCDEPVQLSESEATPFYFVLPPATYESFVVVINTADGKVMMQEGSKPLTIKRSDVQPTAGLQYIETTCFDLSVKGTANSYIVSEAGYYSIDADIIGNGEFGIIPGANFHTTDPTINPSKAELLWEDNAGLIAGVNYDNGKITFVATGAEGNAVIAAKDADGTILWSWHIWCTDEPAKHVYVNSTGNYTVLDRNLGATRADRGEGEEWKEAVGLAYQWGRKDPFNQQFVGYTTYYDRASVEEAIANPNIYYGRDYSSWLNVDMNPNYWTPSQKTIYDPCPAGYMVAYSDVWRSFTTSEQNEVYNVPAFNIAGEFDHGWDWIFDGVNASYYPINFNIESYFVNFDVDQYACEMWRSELYNSTEAYVFQYRAHPNDSYIFFMVSMYDGYHRRSEMKNGRMVRCVADSQAKSIVMTVNKAQNVTSESAEVSGRAAVYGKETIVTERGFVYGTDQNVTHANGHKVLCGDGSGDFNATIEGLKPQTKYYVKSYAITADGETHYSSAINFITPGDGGLVNLSAGGTANCYIVYPVKGKYAIDLVKGNSKTSVGNATSAAVLWETYNTTESVTVGTVVESAKIENGKLVIEIPENARPGNALVAVKNSSGTILWSWHIWVTDFNPDETQQTYISGAVLMDRNLGALSIDPSQPAIIGMMYQYGRKDPFVGSGNHYDTFASTYPENAITYVYRDDMGNNNTMDFSVKNPTSIVQDCSWNDDNLWTSAKSTYDPCPAGWRVPDQSVWESESRSSKYGEEYLYMTYSGAMYPMGGYIDYNCINSENVGYYWATYRRSMYLHYGWDYLNYSNSPDRSDCYAVRCQKIDQSDKPGNGDDYVVDDEYEWE